MTELVLKNGDRAVATLRKPEVLAGLASKHGKDKLLVLKLDVTHPDEIKAAFDDAVKHFGRVDVVFNNAGYSVLGEIEGLPEEVGRAVFDTNVWGATNVSKEAVRVFRDVNKPAGGLLLQNSSQAGIQAYPGLGHYSATKYGEPLSVASTMLSAAHVILIALEGISTALAAEVEPEWNIKVRNSHTVQPTCLSLRRAHALPGGDHRARQLRNVGHRQPRAQPAASRLRQTEQRGLDGTPVG